MAHIITECGPVPSIKDVIASCSMDCPTRRSARAVSYSSIHVGALQRSKASSAMINIECLSPRSFGRTG